MTIRAVLATLLFAAVSLPLVAQGPRRDGRWEVKMEAGRGAMAMKYTGKRLGDCTK